MKGKLEARVAPGGVRKASSIDHLLIYILVEREQPHDAVRTGEAISYLKAHQETLALLKVLALTNRQVEEGKLRPAAQCFARIRKRLADSQF
ncbi:hypothetical protein [Rhizobium acidisoli]|uniref:hypothetical protein n=1 Tax=Rhizobium acidisoli TaxID=1538158 RepID=UPI0006CCF0EB|nr:hypothetical protein AOG23_26735 [Rhizobium acidisoli]